MSKNNYILVYWYRDDIGDYTPTWESSFVFVAEKELDDIKGLMREHGVKRWVKDPHAVTEKTWKEGDASLIEYRNIEVRPVKMVEAWGYSREKVNE